MYVVHNCVVDKSEGQVNLSIPKEDPEEKKHKHKDVEIRELEEIKNVKNIKERHYISDSENSVEDSESEYGHMDRNKLTDQQKKELDIELKKIKKLAQRCEDELNESYNENEPKKRYKEKNNGEENNIEENNDEENNIEENNDEENNIEETKREDNKKNIRSTMEEAKSIYVKDSDRKSVV